MCRVPPSVAADFRWVGWRYLAEYHGSRKHTSARHRHGVERNVSLLKSWGSWELSCISRIWTIIAVKWLYILDSLHRTSGASWSSSTLKPSDKITLCLVLCSMCWSTIIVFMWDSTRQTVTSASVVGHIVRRHSSGYVANWSLFAGAVIAQWCETWNISSSSSGATIITGNRGLTGGLSGL